MTIAQEMRVSALDWWHSLAWEDKYMYAVTFFQRTAPELLTGREVEQIYRHKNYLD